MPDSLAMPSITTSAELASRYVDVGAIAWEKTRFPGVEWKILMQDEASGLLTCVMRWAAGARLPLHEHVEIEQTWVIEGSFEDHQGVCTAGNYVWRPKGIRHEAWTRDGCVLFAVFLKPNIFFDQA